MDVHAPAELSILIPGENVPVLKSVFTSTTVPIRSTSASATLTRFATRESRLVKVTHAPWPPRADGGSANASLSSTGEPVTARAVTTGGPSATAAAKAGA